MRPNSPKRKLVGVLEARDELLRAAAFSALDVLCARLGETLPLKGGIDQGFVFNGKRVPFLNYQKGIYRSAEQMGPAALSVLTSSKSPYGADEEAADGYWYAFRAGPGGSRDNAALRAAHHLQVPLAYFRSFQPGWYTPIYPVFVDHVDDFGSRVFLTPGIQSPLVGAEPTSGVTREYAMTTTRRRLHQGRFREMVMRAYAEKCTICRLKEPRLLEAAHIRADAHPDSESIVSNGLSLCSIHHKAFDETLIGIDPDYRVHVAQGLLGERDGPMLELLKTAHGTTITAPRDERLRPDRELLAERFERFAAT